MKLSLTQKVSILLFIPAAGALIALSLVYSYLNQMDNGAAMINLAGRQRMLSKQQYIYADMVNKGQEEDRSILRESRDSFDLALQLLTNGGHAMGQSISSVPPIALDELARVKATWANYKKAVDIVVARPMDDLQARQAFDYIVSNTRQLTDDSNRLVNMIETYHHTLQRRMLYILIAVAAFDLILLFIGVWLIRRYIADRKQVEDKLRLSEERFSLVTHGIKEGLWDLDLTSGKIYFSPHWKSMLGYREHEIENNFFALQDLIHEDDLGQALDAWVSSMGKESDAFSIEYRLRDKQGKYCWILCRGLSIRNADDEHIRMMGSHTDITERKRIEEELQAEHAEQQVLIKKLSEAQDQLLQSEKMASIGQLAAGVAHEINNPVGYINSNIGSLKNYIEDLFKLLEAYEQAEAHITDDASKQLLTEMKVEIEVDYLKQDLKDLLAESEEGVVRVKQIVQDLKDFSHVDEAEWQWADLHKGLDSTLNVVRNEIKYKAEVIKDYGELPEVQCLASQLNQVFMNLLVNAAHAIEEHGTITVRTGTKDDGVWVEVEDTGKGMDIETQKKIFDPFFTTKPVGSGTGLGLSLSYSIIQKHDGSISVDSKIGQGSRFHIWLPVKQLEKGIVD